MLDSLVRVSRRVDWVHFVSILTALPAGLGPSRRVRGTSKLSSRSRCPVSSPHQGTGRDCRVPQSRGRHGVGWAVTTSTPSGSLGPVHLPATRDPGRLADADQHGADDAWPVARPSNIHARRTAPKRFPFSNFKSF